MPLIVRDLTRDEAIIAMVDANLQRETILPSEKALSYKMKLDAMKRQGQRTDLTSTPVAWKSRGKETAEIVGETSGDSKDQVRRYIRLTELIPQMLQLVDEGKIALRPAVELQSPYFASKDEAHKRKCQRTDYLPNTAKAACTSLRSTAREDTERYRRERSSGEAR
jgi:hypothetical protein